MASVDVDRLLAKRQKLIEADEANGFAQLQMIELKQALLHKEQQKETAKHALNRTGEYQFDPLDFARRQTASFRTVLRLLFYLRAKLRSRRFPHGSPSRMVVFNPQKQAQSQLGGVGHYCSGDMECDYCERNEEMSAYYSGEIWCSFLDGKMIECLIPS